LLDPWEAWLAPNSFNFQFGTQDMTWHQYTTLVAADGLHVTLDDPKTCLYQSDINGMYILNYGGPGDLWGIPSEEEIDLERGYSHWKNAFALDDLTALDCGGETLYTKAIDLELTMPSVEATNCADLGGASIGAPADNFVDPDMDEAPEVTDPPAVVGGILQ
jgi:hypothetical protein